MLKSVRRLITSACFLVTTGLLVLGAKNLTGLFFSFYPKISRGIMSFLGGLTAPLPFAVWEILLIALGLWLIISFFVGIFRRKFLQWLTGVLLWVSVGAFFFVGAWGLNYFAPSMASRLELSERQYTPQELRQASEYYLRRANETALMVERDENGVMRPGDFDELALAAGEGYKALGQENENFSGSAARVKHLLCSPLMGANGTTGIFVAFTGEAGVSSTTFTASVPFTMCHEIGHRMAFAREDEANFAGFLAATRNERPDFQYSGYYNAFIYCYNALYRVDPESAGQLMAQAGPGLRADLSAASAHYDSLEDEKASQMQTEFYDTYLKTFAVESGVQSYGQVVDLLTAWYFEKIC